MKASLAHAPAACCSCRVTVLILDLDERRVTSHKPRRPKGRGGLAAGAGRAMHDQVLLRINVARCPR